MFAYREHCTDSNSNHSRRHSNVEDHSGSVYHGEGLKKAEIGARVYGCEHKQYNHIKTSALSFKRTIFVMFLFVLVTVVVASSEFGSYQNPHPRPAAQCDNADLAKLSQCCSDVLEMLDDCKANDLACECCALQSMDQLCYHLCPGNPSTNFLTVLLNDCAPLNDVNACNLPFKKVDGAAEFSSNNGPVDSEPDSPRHVSLKSQLHDPHGASPDDHPAPVAVYTNDGDNDTDEESMVENPSDTGSATNTTEQHAKFRPHINLFRNMSTTSMSPSETGKSCRKLTNFSALTKTSGSPLTWASALTAAAVGSICVGFFLM